MERRGRIPIAKFRTPEGKPRSRSRARDLVESDPEMDMFNLLEENSTLKEENKNLNLKISEYMENIKSLENENLQLRIQIKNRNDRKPEKLIEFSGASQIFEASTSPIIASNIKKYSHYSSVTQKHTKEEFIKMFSNTCTNEFESLLDFHDEKTDLVPFKCIQNLLNEFSQLKTNFNNIELQLYEANEKIAELMEHQTFLEEENKILKNRSNGNKDGKDKVMSEHNGSYRDETKLKKTEQNSPEHIPSMNVPGKGPDNENSCGERIVEVVLTL